MRDLSTYEGWLENTQAWSRIAAEQLATIRDATDALRGQQLLGVRYYAMPHTGNLDDVESFWVYDFGHQVAYGVDLITDRGTTGVTWVRGFQGSYVLDIIPGPIVEHFDDDLIVSTLPSSGEPWASVTGSTIDETRLLEDQIGTRTTRFTEGVIEASASVPVALSLKFSNGGRLALISACHIADLGPLFAPGSWILVAWRRDVVAELLPGLSPAEDLLFN
jgi:hypothetical protein